MSMVRDTTIKVEKGGVFRVTAVMGLAAFSKLGEISKKTRLPKTRIIERLILEFGDELKQKAIEELKD